MSKDKKLEDLLKLFVDPLCGADVQCEYKRYNHQFIDDMNKPCNHCDGYDFDAPCYEPKTTTPRD